MRKNYRRYSRRSNVGFLKPGFFIISVFVLGLLMVWKSNMVKEFYSRSRSLEGLKSELNSEISVLKADLMEQKSISKVGAAAEKYGLTQNVAERRIIKIPGLKNNIKNKRLFVDMDMVADWLEGAVFKSGKIDAKEQEK